MNLRASEHGPKVIVKMGIFDTTTDSQTQDGAKIMAMVGVEGCIEMQTAAQPSNTTTIFWGQISGQLVGMVLLLEEIMLWLIAHWSRAQGPGPRPRRFGPGPGSRPAPRPWSRPLGPWSMSNEQWAWWMSQWVWSVLSRAWGTLFRSLHLNNLKSGTS